MPLGFCYYWGEGKLVKYLRRRGGKAALDWGEKNVTIIRRRRLVICTYHLDFKISFDQSP